MSWANEYVGIPWLWRGRDRTGIDCYGLVRLVYREQLSVELPEEQYLAVEDVEDRIGCRRPFWSQVSRPEPFDVAIVKSIMRDPDTGQLKRGPWHLSIFVCDDQVMDCREPVGVAVRPTPANVVEWLRGR